ncbi:GNAT family N-acetyltransferase [Clostridium sp. AM58-1XD]|uniref:GNAT family N-acetyltransferase n=1 Tax=Clostridium sp. AM58-1XD TaxID=2292307 RepID=UPI000E54D798|nr:GNAT family N-acetyltransferase [Clostridium sp. AM58-1XD]RGY99404.1 GNAT family N-acetyltransferase [Clostridium sp. AM58-1XD]
MKIRKATERDLERLLEIYEEARIFMAENGNPNQWGTSYPEKSLLIHDLEEGCSYVCTGDDGQILGTFYFRIGDEPNYHMIYDGKWLNDNPYAVVHRIASAARAKGAASFCLEWCFSQYNNIRIDTHRQNLPMQHMLEKNGFTLCGTVFVEDGSERIAYQKN